MNVQTLANYVNQDIDDTYTVQQITQWFNKGIAQYNLIPPLTVYPSVSYGGGTINEQTQYPLNDTFMLAVMLPFITSSIRGSEASLSERQLYLQDFYNNSATFKSTIEIPLEYRLNQQNDDLDQYQIGENVFLTDFTRAPFAGEWQRPSVFSEIIVDEEEE